MNRQAQVLSLCYHHKKLGQAVLPVIKCYLTVCYLTQASSDHVKPLKEIADRFIEEARIMSKFDHPHIIRLIGVCTDRSPIFIVMELCEKGSLREYLQKNENYFDQQNLHLIRYVKQLASALSYLESQSFVHRYAPTRYQTDTLKSLCDWSALSDSIFDWLRAPSS